MDETAIDTTEGDTADAIVSTSAPLPAISINVRVFAQFPSVDAKRAFVRLSTQTFVGGVLGETATATPPATIAPIKKPIMTLLKEEIVLILVT
jgi:hypothetical protein